MKKFVALLLACLMVFSLAACGNNGDSRQTGEPNNSGAPVAAGDKVVKIGVFEPQSGDNGAGGKQ